MGLAKARIENLHSGEAFEVLFNPEEYALSKDNNFASHNVPGLSSPILQFVHGNLRTLTMELFFDTSDEARDVREETEKVVRLATIDSELHAPPPVSVSWGSLLFTGVLSSVNQTFNRFLSDGRPVRARLNVTWSELVDPDRESREVNRQTADFSKRHVVSEGETLAEIAARYYEQPAAWRAIALENGIDDPRRALFAGREIVIPSLPYLDPETGEALA
jgi:LysM repeat protein